MKQAVAFQRIEACLLFLGSLYFYNYLHFNIVIFILLLFTIDIFMLGYLKDNKLGAYVYNVGHSMIAPIILIIVGVIFTQMILTSLGLIWLAHIGWDRAFGYGLKYEKGFKHTHLGHLGSGKDNNHED